MAIRKRWPGTALAAWTRRAESVAELRARPGLVDLATDDPAEAVAGADCVVLAMPTGHMAAVVERIPRFDPVDGRPVLVTDVGSVKGPVVREIDPLVQVRGGKFLGGHPMAGSEKKGLDHAEADLFEGASVILTPAGQEEKHPGITRLTRFWEGLGGVVTLLDPDRHDDLVAGISHLPHLVAAALARSVLGAKDGAAELSGGGFRDTTRVAGGPEEMWAGILHDNREAVSRRLDAYLAELRSWREALDSLDSDRLRDLLCEARHLRGTLAPPPAAQGAADPL